MERFMKKLLLVATLLFTTLVASYTVIFADYPKTISFQGRITDNSGSPISGTGTFDFTFTDGLNYSTYYNAPNVHIEHGLYNVIIDLSKLENIDFSTEIKVTVKYNNIDLGITTLSASPFAFYAASSTYANYASTAEFVNAYEGDLAEIYASNENLEPGDVVIISQDIDNNIEISKSSDSIKVAGVISSAPGLVINSKEEGYKLALVGKVPVKVVNEGGPIARGDLLTTSSTPGHAKKASDVKPGSIIGKALENFNGSEGTILVLVNLQ
jgi:hypothetical protein